MQIKSMGITEEEALCRELIDKLKGVPRISWSEIAKVAFQNGLPRLATKVRVRNRVISSL